MCTAAGSLPDGIMRATEVMIRRLSEPPCGVKSTTIKTKKTTTTTTTTNNNYNNHNNTNNNN
jgi:hypothetical protein